LGQALDQIQLIKNQQLTFSTLSTQLATGKKTQKFSGLGTNVLISERARADFKSIDIYTTNIVNAERRLKLTLNSIEEFQAQARNLSQAMITFSQESEHQERSVVFYDDPATPDTIENIPIGFSSAEPDVDLKSLQQLAGSLFNFFVDLINAQENDRYLMGGAETLEKPLSVTGTLDAAISTLQTNWKAGTITTDDIINDLKDRTTTGGNLDALTDTVIGYNSALSNGNVGDVFIRISDQTEIDYTTLGNDKAFRDILVAAAYLKNGNMPPIADEVEIDPNTGLPVIITEGAPGATLDEMKGNFYRVFNDLTAMVNDALDDLDTIRFKLESVRARIDETKQNYAQQKNVLVNTISDVENVDIDEVALKINTLRVQLDASFRVTALASQLSLVNFVNF
jgi:flagellar hook-associated protein 3 FlgL